jgi:hypothetical protein
MKRMRFISSKDVLQDAERANRARRKWFVVLYANGENKTVNSYVIEVTILILP